MATEAIKKEMDIITELIRQHNPEADTDMVMRAFELADEAHITQFRKSGEPYIMHPVAVAHILAELKMDVETIAAALLHDVIEDTKYSHEYIEEHFSPTIADLVEGVTKIGKIEFQTKEEKQAENLRKMVMAMSKDIRVIIIKLSDRLHNMRTLQHMKPEKQQEKSTETIDIYAPIANRLGIQSIKAELEDLALKYLDHDAYEYLTREVKLHRNSREEYVASVIKILKKNIADAGIEAEIYGRAKHFYSIYKKMKRQHKKVNEIYDIVAVRVIVDTVKDCYGVLGIVHSNWKPIPGRFKDYIAMPKPNMYQSIHTTVIGPSGNTFEVQIRTKEMHEIAEYGIAAHWKYKEGISGNKEKDQRFYSKMAWLRQLTEWQKELDNAGDLMETMKVDLFNEEVYVFTPQGKVFDLPEGSCPLDFAYRIHSDVGNTCVGAKVNNKIVPLNYRLKNGDIVEIMTSKNSNGPSRDWLNFVKSAHARNKIRVYFKREEKEENIAKGKAILENELKRQGLAESNVASISHMEQLSEKMGYKALPDLYAAIGYSGVKMGTLFQKLRMMFPEDFPEETKEVVVHKASPKRKHRSNVVVAGLSDIDVHYAKCCNPVPGDSIIGVITQSKGISVHRIDCTNVLNVNDPSRIVTVEWNKTGIEGAFNAELRIKAHEKKGLLIEINNVFIEMNIVMSSFNARNDRGSYDYFEVTFEVKSAKELDQLIKNLNKIPEVIHVQRM